MPYETKQINFGGIAHFLYVRINCLCADLGYNYKDFIEQSYCILTELIDEKGVTHFKVLQEQYKKYEDYRDVARYAPRNSPQKHAFVVDDIHEEIYQDLVVIKDEHDFSWAILLSILLMVMELEIDKQDKEAWKNGEIRKLVVGEFIARRTSHDARSKAPIASRVDTPHQIEKTKKRSKYEKADGRYPEGEHFRKDSEDD
jgi:hypothetical protein